MNKYDDIKIPNQLDAAIIQGVAKAKIDKEKGGFKMNKKVMGSVAASFAVILGLGIANPAMASKLPVVGNVFEAIEKNIYFPGNYSEYATSVNETVYSNGIGVTLSEILCDGQSLFVSYIVESEEPFPYRTQVIEEQGDKVFDINQLIIEEAYSKVDFTNEELDSSGHSGLEGKFIDEYTFVGVQQYQIGKLETEIPEEFMFQTKIILVENYALNGTDKDDITFGTWAFKVPVKVNKELKTVIEFDGVEENGAAVNSVSITPFNMVVDVRLPEDAIDEWDRYDIFIYDEFGTELSVSQIDFNDIAHVTGIYAAPSTESKTLRVVIEKGIWVEVSEGAYTHNESDTILDQVVEIK
ncbi:MAG: DUF4179 domain-containing protein [Turicibacter sp.]